MKFLFEEYSDLILTIIGGFAILSIVIYSCLQVEIDILHSEETNKMNPVIEKIGDFKCKDILVNSLEDDLLKNVSAFSNTGIDIKDRVITRIIKEDDKYYIEYILKYNNDFMIKKVKCHIKEEYIDEDDV